MSMDSHQVSRESNGNNEPLTAASLIERLSNVDVEQAVNCGGSISDSGGRNRGDNHDDNQDNSAVFHNTSYYPNEVGLDATENVNQTELSDSSSIAAIEAELVGHDLLSGNRKTGVDLLSMQRLQNALARHEHIAGEKKKKQSLLIGRRTVTFDSDTNNNALDGDIDSSDTSNYQYGNKREEESDISGSSSDISNLQISSPAAAAAISTSTDTNQDGETNINTGVRRRNLSKRSHCQEEKLVRLDLINSAAVPPELNWDEQRSYKKQKLKIMKDADGTRLGATPARKNHSHAASAYFCRLSKDDFDGVAIGSPSPSTNKSGQSDIFKCNDKASSNDGSILNKSLTCIKNFFVISHSQRKDPNHPPSKLKQLNEIKLQARETSRDVITREFEDSSSVADEDNSPEMAVTSESDYKTFKGSSAERRHSRSKRNQSRESQHRLSQTSGYSKLDHHHYQTANKRSFFQEIRRISLLLVIILISCLLLWQVYELLLESYNFLGVVKTPSILGEYRKYAVSTDAEPCAKIGSDLLANGGSAVDAAIGTLICMGVILPNSLGLGGGCLMTIYDAKKKEAVVIDGRETAPVYAHENMFANDSLQASRGPLSIGVPGELAAYWKAHQRFGKLQWSHLFNGSIKYAEEGYPMVEHLSNALKDMSHAKYMNPSLSKLYTNPEEGRYYRQGEIFVQPVLAATLKRIRDSGADEFYGGLTGQNFIQDLKDQGGKMTLEDLMKYEALTRAPLQVKVADDLLLYTQPPPGSGVVLSIILRVMHKLGYYKNLKPQASFEAAELYYHRLAESFKFAYGQRAGLEDNPDDPERMKQLMEKLLSEKFIEEISSKVDGKTHNNEDYGGLEYFRDDHGTAHVSVLDAEGNAAAVSTSVNLYFGAGMYSPSTGITYNDVMDDFVSPHLTNKFGLAPSKYNRIRPGKRPLSSMVPSIFTDTDGNVRLVVGGAGGTKITTGVAMVSLRNCFLGEDIKTSIDGPRIHHQFLPNKLYYEINFPKDLVHSLSVIRNHTTEAILGRSSIIMGIASERTSSNQTRVTANSDYRKGGSVHGQ